MPELQTGVDAVNGDHPPMRRVSKRTPCPVCGKGDWCLLSPDGAAAICPRVSDGAVKECGAAGWLHVLAERPKTPTRPRTRMVRLQVEDPETDFGALVESCAAKATRPMLAGLAERLDVSSKSLRRLGVGWSDQHSAWSFPMADAAGRVRGIRLRSPSGAKYAVTGSRDGLFVPKGLTFGERPLICEGPTDTAAMLGLGFEVVGRPSCTGGVILVCELVQGRRPPETVIVADNGEPGVRGAEALASRLIVYCPAVQVIYPPEGISDARAWAQSGAKREDILKAINAAPVRRLKMERSKR